MTLAAGFICADGIVLASDSQYTGVIKRYANKTWHFQKGSNHVGLSCAGDGGLISLAKEGIEDKLTDSMSFVEIKQLADDVAYRLWAKHLKNDKEAELSMLLAIRTPAEIRLFENATVKEFSTLLNNVKCVGSAHVLGMYLSDRIFDGSTMTTARNVAAYMLKQAERYEPDGGVGGASQILLVPSDRSIPPNFVDLEVIQDVERQLDRIDKGIRTILSKAPGVVGVDINVETRERRDETFDTAMSAANTQYVQVTGVAAMALVGTFPSVTVTPSPKQSDDDDLSGVMQPPPKSPD